MLRALALAAITLYIVAAIAGASYYAVEIRKLPHTEANLLIGLILTVLLVPPAIYAISRGSIAGRRRRSTWQAEKDARVAAFSQIPGAAPFLPLLRSGYPMTEAELRSQIARANDLLAVPHRAPFVQSVYDGHPLANEQIDYLAFPDQFALCEHFRPLEAALKQAGLLSFHAPGRVIGSFRPQVGEFPIPPGIEQHYISRSSPREDDDHFLYRCPVCQNTLVATCNGPLWPP
jgi:hypothetical protein